MANTLDWLLRSGFRVTRGVKDFSETWHSAYLKEDLMRHFRLKERAAEKSLNSTTIIGTRCAKMPLVQRYKSLMNLSKYRRCGGTWYMDTFFLEEQSISG